MIQNPGNALREIIVQPINAVGFWVFRLALEQTFPEYQFPETLTDGRIVRKILGNDVRSTGQGIFHRFYTLFRVYIGQSQLGRILSVLGINCGS